MTAILWHNGFDAFNPATKRTDAAFFVDGDGHTLIATVVTGDREVQVFADGEMRIDVYSNDEAAQAGDLSELLGTIRTADDLEQYGIRTDDDIASERLVWSNNAWFDLYDSDGTHLNVVSHSIEDALILAASPPTP